MASSAQLLSLLTTRWAEQAPARPATATPRPAQNLLHKPGVNRAGGGEPELPPRTHKRRRTGGPPSNAGAHGVAWRSSRGGDTGAASDAGGHLHPAPAAHLPSWVLPGVRLRSVAPSVVRLLDLDHVAGHAPPAQVALDEHDGLCATAAGMTPAVDAGDGPRGRDESASDDEDLGDMDGRCRSQKRRRS